MKVREQVVGEWRAGEARSTEISLSGCSKTKSRVTEFVCYF